MTRSLRFRLAARVTGSITLALVAISLLSLVRARGFKDTRPTDQGQARRDPPRTTTA